MRKRQRKKNSKKILDKWWMDRKLFKTDKKGLQLVDEYFTLVRQQMYDILDEKDEVSQRVRAIYNYLTQP